MQHFFAVVPIQDLSGLWEQFPGGVPDPARTIAQHYTPGSCRETSPCGFAQHTLGKV
jgi:hypothetical protein